MWRVNKIIQQVALANNLCLHKIWTIYSWKFISHCKLQVVKFQQEKDKRANYTRTCETGRIQDTTGVWKVFRAPLMLSVPWVSHDVCISSCSVQSLTLYFFLQTIWNMSYVLQCFDKKENKASFKSCSIHSLRELFDCGYRQSRFYLLQSFKKWDLKFQNLYCLLLGSPHISIMMGNKVKTSSCAMNAEYNNSTEAKC